jgi:hypothetical protein
VPISEAAENLPYFSLEANQEIVYCIFHAKKIINYL